MPHLKNNDTSFKPGRKKTGGRKAGVRNKKTMGLLQAVFEAAEAVGSDGVGHEGLVGYLQVVALNNPPAFCRLIGRVLLIQHEEVKQKNAAHKPAPNDKYDRSTMFGRVGT